MLYHVQFPWQYTEHLEGSEKNEKFQQGICAFHDMQSHTPSAEFPE